ncbi:MAG: hypothetical protein II806_04405 [Bacteroidaceae bacterium]|nr:hypothetical protein [Bacteroidaceae bacterium]
MKATFTREVETEVKYLVVDAHVRNWDSGEVNGEEDDDENPRMPFANKACSMWNITIDVDEGRIVDWPEGVRAGVFYKVCDEGVYSLLDADKNLVERVESYVPDCLAISDTGYGDYICFDVEPDGHIEDWEFNQDSVDELILGDFNNED